MRLRLGRGCPGRRCPGTSGRGHNPGSPDVVERFASLRGMLAVAQPPSCSGSLAVGAVVGCGGSCCGCRAPWPLAVAKVSSATFPAPKRRA
eukprot:5787561-Pyramimonas_sp.AAC.1